MCEVATLYTLELKKLQIILQDFSDFLSHKKRDYHVLSASDASDPLANVRNVHENSSFF